MYSVHQERKFRSALRKLVNPSGMKSHRVTLHSVQENLSRWNWNSSVSREQTLNGSSIGEASVTTGYYLLA